MSAIDPNTVYGANFYKGVGAIVGIVCWLIWAIRETVNRVKKYKDCLETQEYHKRIDQHHFDFGNEQPIFARKEYHLYGYKVHIYTPDRKNFPRVGRKDTLYTDMTARIDYGWTGTTYCEVVLKE